MSIRHVKKTTSKIIHEMLLHMDDKNWSDRGCNLSTFVSIFLLPYTSLLMAFVFELFCWSVCDTVAELKKDNNLPCELFIFHLEDNLSWKLRFCFNAAWTRWKITIRLYNISLVYNLWHLQTTSFHWPIMFLVQLSALHRWKKH